VGRSRESGVRHVARPFAWYFAPVSTPPPGLVRGFDFPLEFHRDQTGAAGGQAGEIAGTMAYQWFGTCRSASSSAACTLVTLTRMVGTGIRLRPMARCIIRPMHPPIIHHAAYGSLELHASIKGGLPCHLLARSCELGH